MHRWRCYFEDVKVRNLNHEQQQLDGVAQAPT